MKELMKKRIKDSINVKNKLLENIELLENMENLINEIIIAIKNGHKLVLCGNGGSASDALHFAGEIVGRFVMERPAWPAIVLNADVATMTAIANDYSYDDVFARQAQGHCMEGDVFIGISTSGNSENVYRAVDMAKSKGCKTAALLGKDGGKIGKVVDYPLIVPNDMTARVQESHILLIHIMCELIENKIDN
ncbi:D-sedoheptulose 7-phosphate isomerase [Eubacterium sp. MSJ-13]|uniref:D-sedoheptulose-7-phosphate isomerase n=1 Tax=Eubacterium sp. MSJ-13 TaxID=2841513 RepID=UPI001C0FB0D7|nr:D-sedoheptulose 7-phosphate isomerase [Eubacterium sp. MSJ-13]MBU5477623.1 D-sedoheptulose 7-phosphate isomerase [Eubacterium sp. MSJ-13]